MSGFETNLDRLFFGGAAVAHRTRGAASAVRRSKPKTPLARSAGPAGQPLVDSCKRRAGGDGAGNVTGKPISPAGQSLIDSCKRRAGGAGAGTVAGKPISPAGQSLIEACKRWAGGAGAGTVAGKPISTAGQSLVAACKRAAARERANVLPSSNNARPGG